MADKDVLSQEEIDALLDNVDKEETDGEKPTGSKSSSKKSSNKSKSDKDTEDTAAASEGELDANDTDKEFEVVNFANQERIVRGELPVLDKIHDRAARKFSNDIYQLMGKELEIKQEQLVVQKHREFFKKLANPVLMTLYRFSPLRGKALILFDSTFVYDLVDYYFGGSSHFKAQTDKTDFTAAELRVMEIVNEKLAKNIKMAWSPIVNLEPSKMSVESNPQLVSICEADELLLISRFLVDFGKEKGSFSLVMPFTMIEPLKQHLEIGSSRPDDEIDPNWVKALTEELMEVELNINCVMKQANSTLGQVMAWKEGDFLPLEMKEDVTLDIEGTPGFTAKLGTANDKRALKIINKIKY